MTSQPQTTDSARTAHAYVPSVVTDFPSEYSRLRRDSPVVHSDDFGGFWTLTKYDDVSRASRDWKRFRSGQPFVEYASFAKAIPISTNPPEHGYFRKFLNQYFTESRVAALVPRIEECIAELLDPFIQAGGGDMYRDVIRHIPARVLADLLGLTDSGRQVLSDRLDEADAARHDLKAFGALQANLWTASVEDLIADREANPRDPAEDIMSGILQLQPGGHPITHEEALNMGTQLFAAGADTTISALASLSVHFGADEQLQAAVRSRPELIQPAIEETLRMGPPIHQTTRKAATSIDLRGQTIQADELVALNVAAANRDEEKFDRPEEFLLDRESNPHLTFGFGPHMCVGAPVARQELRIFAEQLLSKTRSYRIEDAPEPGGRPLRTGWASIKVLVEPNHR